MIRWFEHTRVYVPSKEVGPCSLGCRYEEVQFQSLDRTPLHGWYFPALPNAQWANYAILLLHGNAGNVGDRLAFYQAWLELGTQVFAFDYRGFGRSGGKASEEGTYLDGQAAFRWLANRSSPHIIALGKSLGGGIASELALREKIDALILQSTFTSIPDVGSELFPWLPVRWLASIHYNTLSKLPRIHVPVLIAHSREDRTVRFSHAERNFAAANEPKMFLELKGGHVETIEADRASYIAGLRKFFSTCLKAHV
ncbi:MAG TPA: alpha/beta hydrolase [Verrucomicrobiae bacterium]|jgi:hypothetical protein